MLISTTGRFKCVYPIHVINHSNTNLYSWNSVVGNKCNFIHVTISRPSDYKKKNNLLESLSLNNFCKSLASIDLNGCKVMKREALPVYENGKIIKQISKYRRILESVTFKTKIMIGLILHIILFLIALVFSRNSKYHKMTMKICTNTKTESLEIKSSCEVTTKVRF